MGSAGRLVHGRPPVLDSLTGKPSVRVHLFWLRLLAAQHPRRSPHHRPRYSAASRRHAAPPQSPRSGDTSSFPPSSHLALPFRVRMEFPVLFLSPSFLSVSARPSTIAADGQQNVIAGCDTRVSRRPFTWKTGPPPERRKQKPSPTCVQ